MTLERTGTGTGRYVSGTEPTINDVFQLASPAEYEGREGPPGPPRITILRETGDEIEFRLEWYTLHGGTNKSRGDFVTDHGRYKLSEGVDCRFPGHAILTQKVTTQAAPDPSGDLVMSHVNFQDELVIGMGHASYSEGVSAALFSETSATDPTIRTRVGGVSSNEIISLGLMVTNNNVQRIVLGKDGTEAIANNNLTGAFVGLDTLLTDLYGLVQTTLPGAPVMFYAGGKLYSLDVDNGYTDTPAELIDRQPPGGYIAGLRRLGAGPLRVYFVMPKVYNLSQSMLTFGAEKDGIIKHFNQRGRDPQEFVTDLDSVKWVLPYRGGFWIAGDSEATWMNGVRTRPINWFGDRAADSDRLFRYRGFWTRGRQLIASVNSIAAPNSTVDTKWWAEEYNFELDTVHPLTKPITLNSSGLQGVTGPSLPISQQTGFAHQYVDSAWRRFFVPPPGRNPYLFRQTSGAGSGTGVDFESTGFVELMETICPGNLAYLPKRVRRIHMGGRIDSTGAKVKVTETDGTFHEFINGYGTRHQTKEFDDNGQRFTFPAPRLDLTQGSNAKTTPQALPFAIDYIAYKHEKRSIKVTS